VRFGVEEQRALAVGRGAESDYLQLDEQIACMDHLRAHSITYRIARCEACHAEKPVASSCKKRGFCPSYGAKRMVESAALLVDEVLPHLSMRQWVLSVPYPLRFLFAREPKVMGKVLGIVYRTIASHLIKQANLTRATAHTGAVTLIQRFGSALNLNVHLHMLFLDGVYVSGTGPAAAPVFRRVSAPTTVQLQAVLTCISQRIGRYLERQGLLVRDPEHDYLQLEALDEEVAWMDRLRGHSITYRIALGPACRQESIHLTNRACRRAAQ
jgi:hypothetical protein